MNFTIPLWLRGFAISAVVTVIVVIVGGYLLGENAQVLFFIVPVVAAGKGGLVAGLLATALSAVVGPYFFIEHSGFYFPDPADRIRIATFVVIGGLISWLIESLHRARRHLEDRQRDLERHQKLLAEEMRQREDAQAALREREERIRLAVECANVGTWDFNALNGKLKWSPRSKAMFGVHDDQEASESLFAMRLHPDDRDRTLLAIDAALDASGQGSYECEYRVLWPDGTTRWLVAKGQAFFEGEGAERRAVRFIGTHVDITEQKALEQTLKEADRRKDEFLATLAHELRNPLAPICAATQILQLKAPPVPEVQLAREVIQRQTQQMTRIMDDLLDLSRISRNKLELRKRRVELATVVHGAVETSRPHIEAGGHDLTVKLPSVPIYLDADPTRISQVFSNLLNNSAKYSERGGRIGLTATREGADLVVTVKDSGIGIPSDQLAHIFEIFAQANRSHEQSSGGLGIGLSLARQIVAMHGGHIEARSAGVNQGSEFVVRMPVILDCWEEATANDGRDGDSARLDLRILVVDDNEDAANTLGTMLRIIGNEIRIGHDGEQAVALAEEFRPDVVLLDIGLPKLNGYDAARRIRAQSWGKEMALIAVSGWGQDEDKRRAREAGFDQHIVKPVVPSSLMSVLAERSNRDVSVSS